MRVLEGISSSLPSANYRQVRQAPSASRPGPGPRSLSLPAQQGFCARSIHGTPAFIKLTWLGAPSQPKGPLLNPEHEDPCLGPSPLSPWESTDPLISRFAGNIGMSAHSCCCFRIVFLSLVILQESDSAISSPSLEAFLPLPRPKFFFGSFFFFPFFFSFIQPTLSFFFF